MTSKYDLVVFSPHLDDAALSCSARIISERERGKHVLVVTLFSAGDDSKEVEEVYKERRQEDEKAMTLLGADRILLGLKDAPCRDKFYSSFERIFLEESDSDKVFQKELLPKIQEIYDGVKAKTALFPLGIGGHIDHRLTHRAYVGIKDKAAIEFYEDRPYVFLLNSINCRLRTIKAEVENPFPGSKVSEHALKELHVMMESMEQSSFYNCLPPGQSRLRVLLRMLKGANSAFEANGKLQLEPKTLTVDAQTYSTIQKAISTYKSQVDGMFGDMQRWEKESQAYNERIFEGPLKYVERTWQLVS